MKTLLCDIKGGTNRITNYFDNKLQATKFMEVCLVNNVQVSNADSRLLQLVNLNSSER